jgi:hypothetical protein
MKQKYLLLTIILFVFLFLFSTSSLALIPGDFGSSNNGPPDGVVDFEDLMIFAMAYGSSTGDTNWNLDCDIYPDGVIDFEDLMIFAMHYGQREGATWTVMVYLDGDNNLYDLAWSDLGEMESVGSTDEVNIVVQLDSYSNPGTYRYYVTGAEQGSTFPYYSADIVQTLPEQNMADPNVLANFINWATTNYPAEHYLLVLWNHGGGWRDKDILPKGIIWDDTSGDFMTMIELAQGLEGASEQMDIIGFDACLMQMAEVAYEIGSSLTSPPSYVIASQELEWGYGWPYDDILNHLTLNSTMNEATLCETVVNDYINYCGTPATLSALHLSSEVSANGFDTINNFANALMNSAYPSEIAIARSSAQSYIYYPEYKDFYDFAQIVYNTVPDCQTEAQAIMDSISEIVIAEAHTGTEVENSHGLSIFLPDNPGGYDSNYNSLRFAIDTQWDEFLLGGEGIVTDVDAITITYQSSMSKLQDKITRLEEEGKPPPIYYFNELTESKNGVIGYAVDIGWHSYYGATGYRVYRSVNEAATYTLLLDWPAPSGYTWYGIWDDDVSPGSIYSYYVTAYGSDWETNPSQIVTRDTFLPPCSLVSPPDGSIVTESTPTFTWNPVGVTSFPYELVSSGDSDLWVWDDTAGEEAWWTYFTNMTTSFGTYNQDEQATALISGHSYIWNSWGYGYDGSGNLIAVSESEDWEFDYEEIEPPPLFTVYRAFLVGVGDYLYGDNDLPAPPYDVDKMYDTLNHSGDGFALINELKDLQATKSAILSGIASTFSQADADDVSYFYFSGHGGLLENISYLIPTDSDGYTSTCISVSELESALSAIPGTKVVILDCCHSGGFIGKQIGEEEISINPQDFNSNIINVFLSRDLTGSQYKVLTSCLSSQVCVGLTPSEGDPFGLFGGVLCLGCGYDTYIHPYPADGNSNSEITLHEAYIYTYEMVNTMAADLNALYGWDIDQDTQVYPINSDFVIIEE